MRQNEDANKRLKLREKETSDEDVKHSLLSQYYREVMTLREYLLSKLPLLSKVRRKKIATIGSTDKRIKEKQAESKDCCAEEFLAHYLDSTLVGVLEPGPCWRDERLKDWTCFSQLADKTDSGIGDTVGDGGYAQSEVSILFVCVLLCLRTSVECHQHCGSDYRYACTEARRSWTFPYGPYSQKATDAAQECSIFFVKDTEKSSAAIR